MKLITNLPSLITRILFLNITFLLLSGCGSLTKMRYSKGFKSNIEFNFGKKDGKRENHIASKAVKKQSPQQVPNPIVNHLNSPDLDIESFATSIQPIKTNEVIGEASFPKKKNNQHFNLNSKIKKSSDSKATNRPIDRTSAAAGILFYGGFLVYFLGYYLALLSLIGSIFIIAGFVLAIVGIGKIKRSNHEYSGMGLDVSIIVLFGLMVLYTILLIALFLAMI